MKLSAAMKLGAMVGPQVFGKSFSGDGSCALGGAILAASCPIVPAAGVVVNAARPSDTGAIAHVPPEWIVVTRREYPCPVCEIIRTGLRLIAHLNDDHRWTREAIADQVEIWERSLEDASVGRDPRCEASESVSTEVVEIA